MFVCFWCGVCVGGWGGAVVWVVVWVVVVVRTSCLIRVSDHAYPLHADLLWSHLPVDMAPVFGLFGWLRWCGGGGGGVWVVVVVWEGCGWFGGGRGRGRRGGVVVVVVVVVLTRH